jgi:hypothetical protein
LLFSLGGSTVKYREMQGGTVKVLRNTERYSESIGIEEKILFQYLKGIL